MTVFADPSHHSWILAASVALFTACQISPERVYVSAEQSGEIVVIDPSRAAVVTRIPVGKRPRGLRLSHDEKFLFVALSGSPRGGPNIDESKLPPPDRSADGIGVVDLETHKLVRTLPGGQDPESFDLSKDGARLFVSNEETAEMSVLDVPSGEILKRIPVGEEPEGVQVRPDGRFVYVTAEESGSIAAVDTQQLSAAAHIVTGQRPRSIVFTRDGSLGFVTNELSSSVSVLDPQTHEVLAQIAIEGAPNKPQRPMGAVLSPDDRYLYVSTGRGGAIAVIDVAKRNVVRMIADVGARPWGIAMSRNGERLYTANGPSDDVSILDRARGQVRARVPVGGSPWGVVVAGR